MPDSESDQDFETEFQAAGSGASDTRPQQCSSLRKGGYVVMKGRPCKIMEMSTSKTGKHGSAKVHLVGIDIFTGKKVEDISPSTANMEAPEVKQTEYDLLDISDDGYLCLMHPNGEQKDDLKLGEGETAERLKNAFAEGKSLMVSVIAAMGEEAVHSFKEAS